MLQVKYKQQKIPVYQWKDVYEMTGLRHLMVTPSSRYECEDIYNDQMTKVFVYTSMSNTSNLLFVKSKGGVVSVIVLSPYFGFYSNQDLQMPFPVDKNGKTINAASILYSIDRRVEYLSEIQDDVLKVKKSCVCESQNVIEQVGQAPELKKGRAEAVQLLEKVMKLQKEQERSHKIDLLIDFGQKERKEAIDELIQLLDLQKTSETKDFDFQTSIYNSFTLHFKLIHKIDHNNLDPHSILLSFSEWKGEGVEKEWMRSGNYGVVFSVNRNKKQSGGIMYFFRSFYNSTSFPEIHDQFLHPPLPSQGVESSVKLKEILKIKILNLSRGNQFGSFYDVLQTEIKALQRLQ